MGAHVFERAVTTAVMRDTQRVAAAENALHFAFGQFVELEDFDPHGAPAFLRPLCD